MTHLVFVYGSLLRGQSNHACLDGARFVGEARTPRGYRLYDLGFYPAAVPAESGTIKGEVYAVDKRGLAVLDRLEGYPAYYDRRLIDTERGTAWMYFLAAAEPDWPLVPEGEWVAYQTA